MCNHDELMARRDGIKQVQKYVTMLKSETSPEARNLALVEIEAVIKGFDRVIDIKLQSPENGHK